MKLAITGGAGFLGYHLCNQLSDKYEQIFSLDIAPSDSKEYPENVKHFNCDVRDKEQLNELFKGVEAVVHAAAGLPYGEEKIFLILMSGGPEMS